LIDQRILIDAPPDAVWQVISDQSQLVRWHAGYTSVSVLTTQQRAAACGGAAPSPAAKT